ncbi:hypothetical protein AKO1_015574 [Acrasis kona]|uniref:Major facilitator superfamily (MFS) profile domain-containing protein n=1 Tax=Acrasis kona TaxID=1008807 RepID=A0AAW2ZI28_9EUKA
MRKPSLKIDTSIAPVVDTRKEEVAPALDIVHEEELTTSKSYASGFDDVATFHTAVEPFTPSTATTVTSGHAVWDTQLHKKEKRTIRDAIKDLPKRKLMATAILCCMFVFYGAAFCMMGPSLNMTIQRTGTDISNSGWLFTVRGIGGAVTGAFAGKIMDRFSSSLGRKISIIGCILISALCLIGGCALSVNLPMALALNGIAGSASSYINVFANTMIGYLWKDNMGTFLQLLHFTFGIGAVLAPLILTAVGNLMGGGLMPNMWDSLTVSYLLVLGMSLVVCVLLAISPEMDASNVEVVEVTAHECIEVTSVETPATPDVSSPQSLISSEETKSPLQMIRAGIDRKNITTYVGCVLLFMTLFAYAESFFSSFVATFVTRKGLMDDSGAALLNSLFWLSFTIGRLVAIFVATKLSSRTIIILDFFGVLGSLTGMIVFMNNTNVFSVCTAILGFSFASVYPATVSLPTTYMGVKMTGQMTSMVMLGSSIGGMVLPVIITNMLENVGADSFIFCILILASISSVLYTLLFVFFKAQQHDQMISKSVESFTKSPQTPVNNNMEQNSM